jgi:hypothetical protein
MTEKQFWRAAFLNALAGAALAGLTNEDAVDEAEAVADLAVEAARMRGMLEGGGEEIESALKEKERSALKEKAL